MVKTVTTTKTTTTKTTTKTESSSSSAAASSSSVTLLTAADVDKMTIPQLKTELTARALKKTGAKADLRKRLTDAVLAELTASATAFRALQNASSKDTTASCRHCDGDVVRLRVKKEGPNTGRYFFKCAAPCRPNTFEWEDEAQARATATAAASSAAARSPAKPKATPKAKPKAKAQGDNVGVGKKRKAPASSSSPAAAASPQKRAAPPPAYDDDDNGGGSVVAVCHQTGAHTRVDCAATAPVVRGATVTVNHNGMLVVANSFAIKDALKVMGFRYAHDDKSWRANARMVSALLRHSPAAAGRKNVDDVVTLPAVVREGQRLIEEEGANPNRSI